MYVLQIVVCPFVLLCLVIVLSVLLRYTNSDYAFGMFKLFIDMSLHSDTLSSALANQSLLFLFNVAWLAEKQQIPIL
jgi:hypothetical protein